MADEKIKLEILGLSSSQSQSGSFALVLGEVEGNRRLPIIIGMFEAQAIAIEIEKIIQQLAQNPTRDNQKMIDQAKDIVEFTSEIVELFGANSS